MGYSDTHRRLHEMFNERRFGEIEAACAPGFMYEDVARALTIKTAGEFTEYLRSWTTGFGDASVGSPQYVDGPDHSVCTFHGRGTNDGPMEALPATGRQMDLVFTEVLHFATDGSLLSGELNYDQLTLLTQLGLASPPGVREGMSAEEAVRDLFATFDSMDVEAMKRRVADDGQGIDEIARRWIRGRDAIEAYIEDVASAVSDVRSAVSDLNSVEYGDTAVVTCWLEQDYTMNGRAVHVTAPATVVLRRDDGDWKAVLIHSIPLPEETGS